MTEESEKSGNMGWGCGRGRWRKWIFLAPILAAGAIALFGYIVMSLWNCVIPAVFTSVGVITFWQAIGILLLSKILFGGFKGRRGCGCCGGGWRGRRMHWKDKWAGMSEEEKAKFKEEWKNRCQSR
jgi:hypothetical protein